MGAAAAESGKSDGCAMSDVIMAEPATVTKPANCRMGVTKVGRPTVYERPMTAAERMRRHRKLKHGPATATPARETRAQRLKTLNALGLSTRQFYVYRQYDMYRAFEWDANILDRKYGRCGMSFIADVCKHAQPEAQRHIHDAIIERGAAFGRLLWRLAKQDHMRESGE
jgi:hypothetical protein